MGKRYENKYDPDRHSSCTSLAIFGMSGFTPKIITMSAVRSIFFALAANMSSRTNCAFERCWESNLLSEDTIHSDEFSSKPVALYPLDAAERTAVPSPLPKSTNSRLRPTAASACLDEMYSRARSTFARGVAMNGSGERIWDITNGAVKPTTQMKDPPMRVRASAVCRRVEPGVEPASSKPSAAIVQSVKPAAAGRY
ncbi:hypothetical protein THAOC_20680 [Thalassiosira oceanica]|uniref:Uncharacterized protein n=1 Tax=Thalassiosira oceanica TaxID=159749 RepID=K0S1N2_THAOC|nr:hypothetical protein THAOC_20680 [Thalassiosira oceanica]|mmetsp:Transcript_1223/g.2619  ORF Transcript_1223/g.2619 Transcript_1223/m.2619 type:complete len:197 (-) Transcript_1223:67-657(-)|eukprot:EJK59135.1 hypothetical protein THAOC_20680 [Thalassiosira oceanica]